MPNRYKVLIVDDTELNRSLLADILSEEYDTFEASNGVEALAMLNQYHTEISLVLLDIIMPEMDGFEVLEAMNKGGFLESIPVIIISSETSPAYIDHAYDLGAAEYVNRPFDEKTVKHRVKNTITLYAKQKQLEDMVTEQMREKEKTSLIMVEILSHIVEVRNGESGLHVLHIRVITKILLEYLAKKTTAYDLSPSRIALIANASALHDIGKMSVPESILNKPGKLTQEEYEIMKTHSAAGDEMLKNIPQHNTMELVRVARCICRWHHERYDGLGYPDGLKGDDIPISAQVVALADVYDALTSERVYKPAFSHEEALQMILDGKCGAFNPFLLECLMDAAPNLVKELESQSDSGISPMMDTTGDILWHNSNASDRTLTLLEQERTKYQFFAKISKEIQFEYDKQTDLLTISDWGAQVLGLEPVIVHPKADKELAEVFAPEDYKDLSSRLNAVSVTDENLIVERQYCLNVNGSQRWYKAVARPLWLGQDSVMTGVIGKVTDIHDEYQERSSLIQLANHDPLTGLYNRQHALVRIDEALSTGLSLGKTYALLLLDLDFFKQANDQFGHIFGDKVLIAVAEKLSQNTRKTDTVARVGGDEFLIFLEYKGNIEPLVERIYNSVNGQRYGDFEFCASMGVALVPQNGVEYENLFHHADQALYAAKQEGRRQYYYYDESMNGLLSALSPIDADSQEKER